MKSFSFSRIDAGLVFKVTINDWIAAVSCFASIGSKLIELIYEKVLSWYDEFLVGIEYEVFQFFSD